MIPILYANVIDDPVHLARFEEIYQRYYKQMYYTANKVLQDSYEAEDALQDAFLGIARNMKTVSRIKNERDLYYYLQSAAKYAALNRLSKKQPYAEAVPLEQVPHLSDNSFWQLLHRQPDYDSLTQNIAALPRIYWEALYYHFVVGFTIAETAAALHISVPAVKQRLVRGKKLLAQALEEEEDAPCR